MSGAPGVRGPGPEGTLRRWWARRRIAAVFERPAAAGGRTIPIRRTGRGIWVATPIRVIEEAAGVLAAAGLLGGPARAGSTRTATARTGSVATPWAAPDVIDAGSGDGRVAAVIAALHPTQVVCGVEADTVLHERAAAHFAALGSAGLVDRTRVHLVAGDYCDPRTYAARAVSLGGARLVLNYPDGNQHGLARFVAARCASGTTLALLTHDRALTVDALPLRAQHDVRAPGGPPWRLSLYRRSG